MVPGIVRVCDGWGGGWVLIKVALAGCGFKFPEADLCRVWWAVNPAARDWYTFIEQGNRNNYVWAYDEYYIPDKDIPKLQHDIFADIGSDYAAIVEKYKKTNPHSLQHTPINPNEPIFFLQLKNTFVEDI